MKTAAEVCRDFVEYDKNNMINSIRYMPDEYEAILHNAKKAVDAAIESGELERLLKAGDQLDTGIAFRGHKIILEITDRWSPGFGCHYREAILRKEFARFLRFSCPDWHGVP